MSDQVSSIIQHVDDNVSDSSKDHLETADTKDVVGDDGKESDPVFGKECVLDTGNTQEIQHIIRTILQNDQQQSDTPEESTNADTEKKPCLIRMFKGDELDENYVYTDSDMVSIISRIVTENIDCFEIEEVQTATYDRLKFFNDKECDVGKGSSEWEEIVHKTPIQELFSMIEFLREQARDGPEAEHDNTVESASKDVDSSEAEDKVDPELSSAHKENDPVLVSSIEDPAPPKSVKEDNTEIGVKDENLAAGSDFPTIIDRIKNIYVGLTMTGEAESDKQQEGPIVGKKEKEEDLEKEKRPTSRPKVTPLDLSMEVSKKRPISKRSTGTPTSAKSNSSRLDGGLYSPLTTAKLYDAVKPLEELYRRNGKDREKLEKLLAAYAKDLSSKCGFIRASDSPIGQENFAFGDGSSATPVC
ncbi:hypothetical protein MJO28_015373 [Puccinia striiformis f. sp. tritici]|uniref:Uncharacterized protein n=1 Tax=Puccinia striiformis f. sp. tritici TaxID=168172 RepID=A0ACC0DU47_9BASI|nr:hypothetical protein Pst134EB_028711 [Puccinia striiformis f. sp. tritici]KAI7938453.1 hypothetical protein MJO28_015373 [Puccinia striiformis f. sp. tritici]KAI9617870.1 hypothetical protein H4Q26_012735 [Puccinia striiformis f. sp. tritici PST-130]